MRYNIIKPQDCDDEICVLIYSGSGAFGDCHFMQSTKEYSRISQLSSIYHSLQYLL